MGQGDPRDLGTWKLVLVTMKKMPKLVLFKLRELKSDADQRNHLDEEANKKEMDKVVLYRGWRKEKVQEALAKLEETCQTVTVKGYCYLNLYAAV
jgi:hypothetical protein